MHRLSLCPFPIPWILVAPILAPGLPALGASLFHDPATAADVSASKVFEEPLRPLGTPSDPETRALAQALDTYVAAGRLEELGPFREFLAAYPDSAWRIPLLVNLGLMNRHVGRTAAALEAWGAAWEAGKDLRDPLAKALVDRALGELLEANAGLGRPGALKALIQAAQGRPLSGVVTEKLSGAWESLAYMEMSPETAFRCGPMALAYLKATRDPLAFADPAVRRMYSTPQGTSLAMNEKWAAQIGLSLQMARREPGADLPVPCVLHLRTGHFAAVTFARNGRYLIQDPFLGDTWVTSATLDQEASGYALVAAGALPKGWTRVAEAEGGAVWGGGAWGPGRPDDTRPDSVKIPTSLALAPAQPLRPAFHADLVSLDLAVPIVRYMPARGPRVDFTVTYNQREYGQPEVFDYCNLGQKWTFSFLACLKDDSTNPDADVTLCNPGGGGQLFHSRGDGAFLPENNTQAVLSRLPNGGYVLAYPSGRREFYELADRAWGLRRVVLTRVQDRLGAELRLTWDAQLRLGAITDATGRVTQVAYESPDPLLISRVTDPLGQVTRFQYDATGRLERISDAQGLVAAFAYGPDPGNPAAHLDFIHSLQTSGGSISFRAGESLVGPSYRRWIEATGPAHDVERLESGAGYAYEIAPEKLPQAPELDADYHPLAFRFRESFFWPAGALDPQRPDYHNAWHIRWGHGPGGFSSGLVLSEKAPAGPRHWFVHTGDFWNGVFLPARAAAFPLTSEGALKPGASLVGVRGTKAEAAFLAPVFDGNRALVTREYWEEPNHRYGGRLRHYDLAGRLVEAFDSTGPTWRYTWDPGTGDLARAASAGKGPGNRFRFDGNHRLISWMRPNGQRLTFAYRADGGLDTWRVGKGAPWSLRFDRGGRLVTAIHAGRTWAFTWDELDRLQDVTAPGGSARKVVPVVPDPPVAGHGPDPLVSPDSLGIGKPVPIPPGCATAFESVLGGCNGPLVQRLLNQL